MQKIYVSISPAADHEQEELLFSMDEEVGENLPVPCRARRRSSVIEYHNTLGNISPTTMSPVPPLPPPLSIEDEGFVDVDEEWCTPVTKILKLPYDHESWQHAHEILDAPSPLSRKVGDEVSLYYIN